MNSINTNNEQHTHTKKKKMSRIAVVGKKRQGKSSLAEALNAQFGYTELVLAKILKESVSKKYKIPLPELHDEVLKEQCHPMYPLQTRREIMQEHGDYMRGEHGEDVFVDRVISQITDEDELVVVSDVRMVNEAKVLRENKFVLVRIVRRRDGCSTILPLDCCSVKSDNELKVDDYLDEHATETESDLIDCDWTVLNGSNSLSDLRVLASLLHNAINEKSE